MLERLGKGGQGKVFAARHKDRPHQEPVAVKVLFLDKMNSKQKEMLGTELSIMETLIHPNIIKNYCVIPNGTKYPKKNGTCLPAFGIVSEIAKGGELFNYLMRGPLPVDIAKCYFIQLMQTIAYCHERNVAHRYIMLITIFIYL